MSGIGRWLRLHLVWQTGLLLAAVVLSMSVLTGIHRREAATAHTLAAVPAAEDLTRATRAQAQATVGLLAGLALAGLLTAWWFSLRLRDGLLDPLRRVETAAGAIAAGELERRVDVPPGDGGLASIGRSINDLADQLHDQVMRHNRAELVLHVFADRVLASFDEPAWLVDEHGRVIAANAAGRDLCLLDPDVARQGRAEPLFSAGGERVGALVRAPSGELEEPIAT